LKETLRRSAGREKRVLEEHTRAQHAASLEWPERYRVDTTGLSVEESQSLVEEIVGRDPTTVSEEERYDATNA
jgi:hypothetical protein